MKRLAEIIIRMRYLILIATVLVTAVLAFFIKDIKVNPDVLSYLPDDDKAAVLFNQVGEKYGGNHVAIIGIESDNVFNTEVLNHVKKITDTLNTLDGISYVTSITDIIDIKDGEYGIEIGKLVDEYNIPSTQDELQLLKNYTMSKDFYKGVIVSDDATLLLIQVRISEGVNKIEVANNIVSLVESFNYPEHIYIAGLPLILSQFNSIIVDDLILVGPIALLIIIIVLLLSFKSFKGVVLPIITVLISTIWTIGIMAYLGIEISLVTNVIPVVLLAIGSAYTIHVINRINETDDPNTKQKNIKALTYIIVPVFIASFTTIVGFASFIFGSYLTMISSFGIFTALGTFFALLLSLTFVPACSVIFFSKKKSAELEIIRNKQTGLSTFLAKLFLYVSSHTKPILTFWFVIFVLSIIGIFNIERKSNMVEFLNKDNKVRLAENLFGKKMGGTLLVYVSVKGDVQSPNVLKAMRKTSDYMESTGLVVNTQSVANMIEEMNNLMGDDGKVIPNERAKIENLWFLIDGQEILKQVVTPELDEGLVIGTFKSGDIKDIDTFIESMNGFIEDNQHDDYTIELTGFPSLYQKLDESIIKSQFTSLFIALLVVLIIISLTFKSIIKGVYALIPIIFTLVALFGFMGLTGISLDFATVLVGSVSIGIGIDYSIHIISHIANKMKSGKDLKEAIEDAIKISGKAVIINVVSVALGFFVLIFSKLIPLQNFGVLVAFSMLISGMASLTLLPSIMLITKKYIKK